MYRPIVSILSLLVAIVVVVGLVRAVRTRAIRTPFVIGRRAKTFGLRGEPVRFVIAFAAHLACVPVLAMMAFAVGAAVPAVYWIAFASLVASIAGAWIATRPLPKPERRRLALPALGVAGGIAAIAIARATHGVTWSPYVHGAAACVVGVIAILRATMTTPSKPRQLDLAPAPAAALVATAFVVIAAGPVLLAAFRSGPYLVLERIEMVAVDAVVPGPVNVMLMWTAGMIVFHRLFLRKADG